jgi:hypothetical protein
LGEFWLNRAGDETSTVAEIFMCAGRVGQHEGVLKRPWNKLHRI